MTTTAIPRYGIVEWLDAVGVRDKVIPEKVKTSETTVNSKPGLKRQPWTWFWTGWILAFLFFHYLPDGLIGLW